MISRAYVDNFRKSTFHMNAFYLMLSTFVLAVSGFLFWIFITRMYDTASVGVATTLLSVSGLLSLLGLAGFDTTFVRFLPHADRKNDYINSGFIVVIVASTVLAGGTALALPLLSSSLHILYDPWFFTSFVFFTVVSALNVLVNAIFLAHKRARYTFVINVLFCSVKVLLPLVVLRGNEATIFILAGASQLVGLVLGIAWLRHKFKYNFAPIIDTKALRLIRKFSSLVYVSSILNLLPPTLLPLMVTYLIGPEDAAYYYMAFTIAGVLYTIAYASMQSVFAEGSHDETALKVHVLKAAKLIASVLVPAAVFVAFISEFLLSIFGPAYARSASSLLQIFALSALPVAIYSAFGAIFKVTKNVWGVVVMNIVYAVSILGFSYFLIPGSGIVAIGWGWLVGNLAACIVGGFFVMKGKKQGG